jgi:hypothetical protein
MASLSKVIWISMNLQHNVSGTNLTNQVTQTAQNNVRFQVLTAASMKMTAFWKIVPCSLAEVDTRFRDAYCFYRPDDGSSTHL